VFDDGLHPFARARADDVADFRWRSKGNSRARNASEVHLLQLLKTAVGASVTPLMAEPTTTKFAIRFESMMFATRWKAASLQETCRQFHYCYLSRQVVYLSEGKEISVEVIANRSYRTNRLYLKRCQSACLRSGLTSRQMIWATESAKHG